MSASPRKLAVGLTYVVGESVETPFLRPTFRVFDNTDPSRLLLIGEPGRLRSGEEFFYELTFDCCTDNGKPKMVSDNLVTDKNQPVKFQEYVRFNQQYGGRVA